MLPKALYHRPAAMLAPPPGYVHNREHRLEAGSMRDAWAIKKSAGFFVWQMRRQDEPLMEPA